MNKELKILQDNYQEENIVTLEWKEHIRRRPGMYIGKLGDGASSDDGIYVLLKEVLDNSIDEFMTGFGKTIEVIVENESVIVQDHGRGVPLGKVKDVCSKMNTGAKYDSKSFKRSVGLNGVGIKAVNALSSSFSMVSSRDGMSKTVSFAQGNLLSDGDLEVSKNSSGTRVEFTPDKEIFGEYHYREEHIEPLLKNYVFLNIGLTINFNGKNYSSKNGLEDLLSENLTSEELYPIIHLFGQDIEVAITHTNQYGEEYYSFVNGQHTT
ncbi:MAG: ATP-binding protein, partial [Fermentimonas sp.]